MTRLLPLLLLCLALPASRAQAEALPVFSDTGPDAAAYGAAEGYPIGTRETLGSQRNLVGAYSHFDQLRPARGVPPAPAPSKLARAPSEIQVSYSFEGKTETLDSYLERNPATAMLIMHGQTIGFEHYRYARTDHDRFTSQSMAKTIVGMLTGIAVGEGSIRSVDDTVATYVPELANTEVGNTPIRALLTMSSGLRFHEVYDGKDDVMRLSRALMRSESGGPLAAVAQFDVRAAAPGTVFNYSGLDTELLALTLVRATRMPLTDYVSQRLWNPIGAEAAASWTTDAKGHEVAYCCYNAVLRDWGRFAALLANDGMWGGRQVIPRQWLLDATKVSAPYLAPGVGSRKLGYGYQLWILPGERRQFLLRGIYGQTILVDPTSHTVLVHLAVRPMATNNGGDQELLTLWNALIAETTS